MLKAGVNAKEEVIMAKMFAAKDSAGKISRALNVEKKVVERFKVAFDKKAKKKGN